ncbi:hypothetical protein E3N88_32141 [Mikania micrantha]|uniref:BED-type domain-containing protein n=1 Tax=Mikania micrantha TaxID=192012 RepID=A0A5N6M856_9ASTR|nr:hypothetical protein E3N88_32141 [Mikania micrantha]
MYQVMNPMEETKERANKHLLIIKTNQKKSKTSAAGGPKPSGSSVWEEMEKFVDEDGNKKAKCKHCNKAFAGDSGKNGTSTLRRHLNICPKNPSKLKDQSDKETEKDIEKKRDLLVDCIKDELKLVFEQYELNNESKSSKANSQMESYVENSSTNISNDFFSQFKSVGGCGLYNTKSELQKYLEDRPEDDYPGFDILQWWKAAYSKYPTLAKMAKEISDKLDPAHKNHETD